MAERKATELRGVSKSQQGEELVTHRPRRRRSTQARLTQTHYEQGHFNARTFLRMATYHFFFPFTLPYIVCREGVVAAANMQLLFVHNFGTMFNSYLVQFGVWTLCFLQFTSIHADGRIHLLFSLAMIAYASRVGVIALKYALLGPIEIAKAGTQRMQFAEFDEWHLPSWYKPTPRLLRKQLRQTCLRLSIPAPHAREIWFQRSAKATIQELLAVDGKPVKGLHNGWITTQDLVLAMFLKVQEGIGPPHRVAYALVSMPIPFSLVVSFLMDSITSPSATSLAICCLATLLFVYFTMVFLSLLRTGVVDFVRRDKLLAMLNSLITPRATVTLDESGNPAATRLPPVVPLGFSHNIKQVMSARILIKNMGKMYRNRIQVVLALMLVAVALVMIGVVVAAIVGWRFAAIASVAAVYSLLGILATVATMILAGDRSNMSTDKCRMAMLLAQVDCLLWHESLTSRDSQQRAMQAQETLYKQALQSKAQQRKHHKQQHGEHVAVVLNPLEGSKGVEKQSTEINARSYDDPRFRDIPAEDVATTIDMLTNVIAWLESDDEMFPVTFLGLRARMALLITGGTLIVSASSVGLRSVFLALVAWVKGEV